MSLADSIKSISPKYGHGGLRAESLSRSAYETAPVLVSRTKKCWQGVYFTNPSA